MNATMRDVAARAGVSIKTVSRVVNGEQNVSSDTSAAVQQAISALDFHPNKAARSLRTGASDTIGVIVDSLSDPFFADIVAVAEQQAMAHGLDVLVASTGADVDRVRTQIQRMARRNPAGMLIAPLGAGSVAGLTTGVPTVLIDRPEGISGFDSVAVGDLEGAEEATRHLLARGHRRIGFLGESRVSTISRRLEGYRRALARAGLPYEESLVEGHCYDPANAKTGALRLLRGPLPPTAIFASTPMTGQGTIAALQEAGRRDVALLVWGDFPLADLVTPPVTVMDQDPRGLAAVAMELLLARIAGESGPPVRRILPTRLILRGSGELALPGEGAAR